MAASLAALIKQRLGIDVVLENGATGQFDVLLDGEAIATRGGNWVTRRFGAGYPDTETVIDALARRLRHQGRS